MKSIESHTIITIEYDSPNWAPLEQEYKNQTGEELDDGDLWESQDFIFEYLKKWDMGGESEHSPQLWVGPDNIRFYRRNGEIFPGYTDTNPTVWSYTLEISGTGEISLDRWKYIEVCDDCEKEEIEKDEEEGDQLCDDCAQDRADKAMEDSNWHHSWDDYYDYD